MFPYVRFFISYFIFFESEFGFIQKNSGPNEVFGVPEVGPRAKLPPPPC